MFKIHYGTCIKCNQPNVIIPVKSGLCIKCNYEKKQESKRKNKYNDADSDTNVLRGTRRCEINVGGAKASNAKNLGRVYSKKPTGEREVFKQIVDNLGDRRECFVCGKQLGELTVSNFAHILPKALNKYPLFKLNIDNIKLFCHDSYSSCHHRFDKTPRSTLTEPMWNKVFELEEKLKEEYKLLKIK